mgnify:CR=1 FL=1
MAKGGALPILHRAAHPAPRLYADRAPMQRCPCCTYPHENAGVLCEVCIDMLSSDEQARYIGEAAASAATDISPLRAPRGTKEPSTRSSAIREPLTPADLPPTPLDASAPISPEPPVALDTPLLPHSVTQEPLSLLPLSSEPSHPLDASTALAEAQNGHTAPPGASTPPSCPVCRHPDREKIDALLRINTLRRVEYGVRWAITPRQVSHHRLTCLGYPPMSKAEAARRKTPQLSTQRKSPMTKRGPTCTVCAHPDHEVIDAALRQGATATAVVRQYSTMTHPFSDVTAGKHRKKCLGRPGPVPHHPSPATQDADPADALLTQSNADLATQNATPRCPFAVCVADELARLATRMAQASADLATLTTQLATWEQQQTALRAWQATQEAQKDTP